MKDLDEDRAAILAVIEAETNAYLRRDYDEWERYWVDSPQIRRMHAHAGIGVTLVAGAEIRNQMRRILQENTTPQPVDAVRRENVNVVIGTDMAWVTYDQIGDISGVKYEMSGARHELKILHKIDGIWKLAVVVGAQRRVDHIEAPLIEVDETAQVLWMNDTAQARMPTHPRLTVKCGQLRAAHDVQDELLSAIAWAFEIRDHHSPCVGDDAVVRVVPLGQDDYSVAQICWVLIHDSKVLVTFDDDHMLQQKLSAAREAYGLSEAQARLARHLVDGEDLSHAAAALNISPNTVRTHLQRIYDKTGVRSQPALMRILLSADRHGI